MLVTTSLILKYKTFPCPPFRPHHRGALTQHHCTHISCPPRHLPNFPITQSPTPLPLTPCLRSHPFATLPINPFTHQPLPPLKPSQPTLHPHLPHSFQSFVHNTQCISFHTDCYVTSSFPISTLFLHLHAHSHIFIDFSPPRTSSSRHLLRSQSS